MSRTNFIDLTADLKEITALAGHLTRVDDLIMNSLEYLAEVIPYDLAAVLEISGDFLKVRVARGPLARKEILNHRLALSDFPTIRRVLESRRARILTENDHAGEEGDPYHGILDLPDGHSCMVVPLFAGDRSIGVMTFDNRTCGLYDPEVINIASIYGQIISLGIVAAEQASLLSRYRRQVEARNVLLAEEATGFTDARELIEHTRSDAMRRIVAMARQVAETDAAVLITGETGTGKEVLAGAIHRWSRRSRQPFITINCAALPERLVESELFGHKKGAFTGADADRAGRFSIANGGTLFLDEIGDLPLGAQARLLRVLQEGTFEPLGSDRTVKVDVRIIAATNVRLEDAIAKGAFREDLFYRLNVFPVALPPLRERLEDIPVIARDFLESLRKRTGRGPWFLDEKTLERLREHSWPGNIRELINTLERAAILTPKGELDIDLPASGSRRATAGLEVNGDWPTLETMEREYILKVLKKVNGKIYGPGGAAEILGLKPSTLQSRMAKLGIRRIKKQF